MVAGRAHKHAEHKPHRSRHPYALRGCVWCGICERRMQSHWVNDAPYCRCRFPEEYALANRVQHPVNVYLCEDQLIGEVDGWLAREFAPHRMSEKLHASPTPSARTTREPATVRRSCARSPSATRS
jgi:site-specific DNA recombinase